MKSLIKTSMALAVILLSCMSSSGSDRPEWVDQMPKDDDKFSYYIGRSSDQNTEAVVFNLATINAREQAIAHNFGIYTQIRTETYQGLEKSLSTQNSEAISQQVRLEDFEQVDFFKEILESRINVWVLYKYKKSAIHLEKKRLASLKKDEEDKIAFMISGNEEGAKSSGTLEVTSTPSGAPVRIDGVSKIGDLELRTPLRLMGLFSAGKHTIEIDDPNFEPVQKEIILYPGLTSKIDQLLKRSVGEIAIESSVIGATIFLGTKLIGTTPLTTPIQAFAGTIASLEIRHPEMKTYTANIHVSRNEKKIEYVQMIPLDSSLSISSDPSLASVEIDGIPANSLTPTGPIKINKGQHIIKIFKDGFHSHETMIDVKGGEKIVLPHVRLVEIKKAYITGFEKFSNDTVKINGEIIANKTELYLPPGLYDLEINRVGFHQYEEKLNLVEGDTKNISEISLKKMISSQEKLINPTFSFGLGYLLSESTTKKRSNAIGALGLSVRLNFFHRFALEASGYYDEDKINGAGYSTDTPNTRSTSIYKIGLPITIFRPDAHPNSGINIIPEITQTKTSFENKSDTNNSPKTKFSALNESQKGRGLSLEYRAFTMPNEKSRAVFGCSFRAGIHKFESTKETPGKKSFSSGIELLIGF